MNVTWTVEDGYVSTDRPQTTYIDNSELDECETCEEREALIEAYVREDFDSKISFRIVRAEA